MGFLAMHDLQAFTVAHPPLQELHQAIQEPKDYNFWWLWDSNPNWETQTKIKQEEPKTFLAHLFHYNMNTSPDLWYLGGNYTAMHSNVDNIYQQILLYVDDDLL